MTSLSALLREKADLGCEICLVHGSSNENDTGNGYKIPAGRMSSLLLVIIVSKHTDVDRMALGR